MIVLGAILSLILVGLHVFGSPQTLSRYLTSWEAGSVKISVPHYFSIEDQASKETSGQWAKVNANWGNVTLRVSVQNLTGQPLNLSSAISGTLPVSPASLHILGIAWLESDSRVLGFCPVSAWQGNNTVANFLTS